MGQAYLMRRSGGEGGEAGLRTTRLADFEDRPQALEENTIVIIADVLMGQTFIQNEAPDTDYRGVAYLSTARPDKTVTLESDTSLRLGLSGAHVHSGEQWEPADTYLYRNDGWEFLWSGQLYAPGHASGVMDDEYTAYTGGWTGRAMRAASNSTAAAAVPVIARREDAIEADTAENSTGGIFCTAQKIDLTPYRAVVFEGEFMRGGTVPRNFSACVWSGFGTYYTSNQLACTMSSGTEFGRIEIDVSGIDEPGYIGLGLTNSKAVIRKCYLTPKDV